MPGAAAWRKAIKAIKAINVFATPLLDGLAGMGSKLRQRLTTVAARPARTARAPAAQNWCKNGG
jgi:hypothetical protein